MTERSNKTPQGPSISSSLHHETLALHTSGIADTGPTKKYEEKPVVGDLPRFRSSPMDFLREVGLYVSGVGWRSFDTYVGQPIFYPGFTEKMKKALKGNPMLHKKIEYLADRQVQREVKEGLIDNRASDHLGVSKARAIAICSSLNEAVDRMIDNMICKMESKIFIRGAYYLASQLITRAYHQGTSS